ncbi:MAG: multifunctional CCA addition/repair protein [Pseudomonadota bacterium]
MKTYLVGGAVRDALMGLPVQDRDWVVVGATPQMLLDQGYLQVGLDFPVFLHPQTKEEYALARTERNTAPGYHGFEVHAAPDVTLEEDLARRDLTINSIAVPADFTRARGQFSLQDPSKTPIWVENGAVVDPYGGRRDIAAKVLRHVTPAFREDPVRILRLARFAARFTEFTVAPETQALLREMVDSGDVDHLVAERVWQELSRGLMEAQPSRMFAVLRDCGALARLIPELDRLWAVPHNAESQPEGMQTGALVMRIVDVAAQLKTPLTVRFACLVHHLGQGTEKLLRDLCQRLRIPVECKELAEVVAREHGAVDNSAALDAQAVVHLLERCDAFRKPARFAEILLACTCITRGHPGQHDAPYPQAPRLSQALARAQSVATDVVAAAAQSAGASGPMVGEAIRQARILAVAAGW